MPFAASYSYSSLSSFSAKSIFRNPPCCVCNSRASSRPSSMSIGYRPLSVLSLRFSHASFPINPLSQLAACLRTTPFCPFCLHAPPRASFFSSLSMSIAYRPLFCPLRTVSPCIVSLPPPSPSLFYSSIPPVSRFNSLLYLRLRPYYYPLHTHSIPGVSIRSATCSFVPAFLHPLSLSSFVTSVMSTRPSSVSSTARPPCRPPFVHPTLAFPRV